MKKICRRIKDLYQTLGMKQRFYTSIICVSFIPLTVMIFFLWQYCNETFSDTIQRSAYEVTQTRKDQIKDYLESVQQFSELFEQDMMMPQLLQKKGNPSLINYWLNQQVRSYVPVPISGLDAFYFLGVNDNEYLICFDEEERHLSLRGEGAVKYQPLRKLAEEAAAASETQTRTCEFRDSVVMAMAIPFCGGDGKKPSVMVCILNAEWVAGFAQSRGSNLPWAYQISSEEEVLFEEDNYEALSRGGLIYDSYLSDSKWTVSCAVSTDTILRGAMEKFAGTMIVIIAAYILLMLLTSRMIARQFHFLEQLRDGMVKTGEGARYRSLEVPKDRDLEFLYHGYNEMVDQIRTQEDIIRRQNEKNLKIAEKQKIAELKALELEINPHYLYNTLNSINAVAVEHQDFEVSRLLKYFASTLVYMLKDRYQPVTVQEEVEWLGQYLRLQKERFDETFDFVIDAEPEISQEHIYKLLLQPFVENAILHGLTQREDGFLTVLFYEGEDELIIKVTDNGSGMSPEELERLQKIAADPMNSQAERMGILNSCRRMYGYYGERYSVKFSNNEDNGVTVEIHLPLMGERT